MTQIERALHFRLVWSSARALHHTLPVNFREERVTHDLSWICQPLRRVLDKQARKQVTRHLVMVLLELKLALTNVREEDLPISVVEGWQARDHLVDKYAKAPPIAGEAVLALPLQDFRRQVLRCAD